MFSRRTDASKVALVWLVALLRHAGYRLLDCQFMTEHLASLGTMAVSRDEYLRSARRRGHGRAGAAAAGSLRLVALGRRGGLGAFRWAKRLRRRRCGRGLGLGLVVLRRRRPAFLAREASSCSP